MLRQRITARLIGLPVVTRLGILVLVVGAGLDLLAHAASPGWALWLHELGLHASGAHMVTLLGMVLILLGLFVRRTRPQDMNTVSTASEGTPTPHR